MWKGVSETERFTFKQIAISSDFGVPYFQTNTQAPKK